MRPTTKRRSIRIAALFVILSATAFVLSLGRALGQANAPATGANPNPVSPTQTMQVTVLDNDRVTVRHDIFPVGGGNPLHAGGNSYVLLILLTPAKLEGEVDGKTVVSDKPGTIWELPAAPSQHAFKNLSNRPIDTIVIQLK